VGSPRMWNYPTVGFHQRLPTFSYFSLGFFHLFSQPPPIRAFDFFWCSLTFFGCRVALRSYCGLVFGGCPFLVAHSDFSTFNTCLLCSWGMDFFCFVRRFSEILAFVQPTGPWSSMFCGDYFFLLFGFVPQPFNFFSVLFPQPLRSIVVVNVLFFEDLTTPLFPTFTCVSLGTPSFFGVEATVFPSTPVPARANKGMYAAVPVDHVPPSHFIRPLFLLNE